MVVSIEQAMAEAILAIRMLRKSIADHGHLEAMIDFDRVMANAVEEAEKQLTRLQASEPS
ncbi:hypothetical protein [Mesorhizobium huakuii]|uniref:Uncharacterized protein n=1 Tax=Mesorhizobium huakuii TaxID=28104 RepID=A0A7G6SN21_9HYPH|nr:hypothetical protein [Mesorhizobium huakuii]QND55903.1 hypothetical protein HB778_03975 [Mesorhizobium huakuii]